MNFTESDTRSLIIGIAGSLIATLIAFLISWSASLPPVPIPLWVIAGVIALPLIVYFVRRAQKDRVVIVANKKFSHESIVLDGKRFLDCEFDRVALVFTGSRPFGMERCKFTGPTLRFDGRAGVVAYQIALLKADPGFAPAIEKLLQPPDK